MGNQGENCWYPENQGENAGYQGGNAGNKGDIERSYVDDLRIGVELIKKCGEG